LTNALAVVGDHWSLLVPHHPNTPAVRLRKLIEHGVPSKELHEARPPRSEYTPTEAGREWTSASN
jgi:DNA-binding HxlR family transcriptional regulator